MITQSIFILLAVLLGFYLGNLKKENKIPLKRINKLIKPKALIISPTKQQQEIKLKKELTQQDELEK